MNRLLILFVACLFSLIASPLLSSAAQSPETSPLFTHLSSILQNARQGQILDLKTDTNLVQREKEKTGTKNIFFVSRHLLSHAQSFFLKKKYSTAIALGESAKLLSPDLPEPCFFLAKVFFYQKFTSIKPSLSNLWQGAYLFSQNNFKRVANHLFTVLLISIFLSCIVSFSCLFFKYLKNILVDIASLLHSFSIKKLFAYVIFFLTLVAAISLGDLPVALIIMPLFLFSYSGKNGKYLVCFFCFLLLVFPLIIRSVSKNLTFYQSGVSQALDHITKNSWDEADFKILKEVEKEFPDNWAVTFSLGTIYKRQGNFSQSISSLQKSLELNSRHPETFVNLANAFFAKKDYPNALTFYQRALELDSTQFEAYFNRGQLKGEQGKVEEATQNFSEAIKINSDKTVEYMNREDTHFNLKIIDCPLPSEGLSELHHLLSDEIELTSSILWSIIFGAISPIRFMITIFVGLLLMSGYAFSLKKTGTITSLCVNCGQLFSSSITSSSPSISCNDCLTIDIKGYNIDTSKKKEIETKIKKYTTKNKNISLLLNLLLPGAGTILGDRILCGFFHLLTSCLLLSELLLSLYVPGSIVYENYLFIILFGVYYILSTVIAIKKK